MTSPILNKIKSRGHWVICIHPTKHDNQALTVIECRDVIRNAILRIRGIDHPFPYFPMNETPDIIFNGQDYVQVEVDNVLIKEVWRMTRSGQFFHCIALFEDW